MTVRLSVLRRAIVTAFTKGLSRPLPVFPAAATVMLVTSHPPLRASTDIPQVAPTCQQRHCVVYALPTLSEVLRGGEVRVGLMSRVIHRFNWEKSHRPVI